MSRYRRMPAEKQQQERTDKLETRENYYHPGQSREIYPSNAFLKSTKTWLMCCLYFSQNILRLKICPVVPLLRTRCAGKIGQSGHCVQVKLVSQDTVCR